MRKKIIVVVQFLVVLAALAISVAVLQRHIIRVINKSATQEVDAGAYQDMAVFSALKYDDAFGYKVSLPNGNWVKMVVIPKPRLPQKDDFSACGTFYATASDGRRVKKTCDEYYTGLDMTVWDIVPDGPEATIDDVLYHPRLRQELFMNMMDNFDDFRWQPDFKELLEQENLRSIE